ncbi:MFS transporter [Catenuloplanes sp. NPDC051500]|uniref:MFS transporter n=1 Tax=Catenuloplanes sp. NPDC051500 TaxID=3363959 RepID=UPI0037BBEBC1
MRAAAVLALGTFALGADAYLTAGLLLPIASDFGASPAAAGQLVTAFTLAYALAAPPLAVLLPGGSRRVLGVALVAFVIANAAGALATSLPFLFATRILAGAAAGVFSPLAATTAAALSPPAHRGRALSLVLAGLSGGSVAGVPAGLLLARHGDWTTAFWLVTALGLAALAALVVALPATNGGRPSDAVGGGCALAATDPSRRHGTVGGDRARPATRVRSPAVSLGERAAALRDRRVAVVVAVTVLQTIASLGAYTYLAPALATAGISDPAPHLCAWGAGGLLGSLAAGPLLDRGLRPRRLAIVLLAVLAGALTMFGLAVAARSASTGPALPFAGAGTAVTVIACLAWGAAGWAFVVPQQHRLLQDHHGAGAAAVGANSSATYLGGAIGAALGGAALGAGLPPAAIPLLGALAAVLGVAVATRTGREQASASRSEERRRAA